MLRRVTGVELQELEGRGIGLAAAAGRARKTTSCI